MGHGKAYLLELARLETDIQQKQMSIAKLRAIQSQLLEPTLTAIVRLEVEMSNLQTMTEQKFGREYEVSSYGGKCTSGSYSADNRQ